MPAFVITFTCFTFCHFCLLTRSSLILIFPFYLLEFEYKGLTLLFNGSYPNLPTDSNDPTLSWFNLNQKDHIQFSTKADSHQLSSKPPQIPFERCKIVRNPGGLVFRLESHLWMLLPGRRTNHHHSVGEYSISPHLAALKVFIMFQKKKNTQPKCRLDWKQMPAFKEWLLPVENDMTKA